MALRAAYFRFYEELNDFLPPEKRKISFLHQFAAKSALKDIVESLGVPHAEIDLALVNGKSVDFNYQVEEHDYVSIYPVFELFDISSIIHLRPLPLRITRFILDVHLGKLARYLRLLGFDTLYQSNFKDKEIITIAQNEKRIILTRDVGLLKNKQVTHGYWLRSTNPKEQTHEIIAHFDLSKKCKPFSRCLVCNGIIVNIKQIKLHKLPENVRKTQERFFQCKDCHRVYWQGTHYKKLAAFVATIKF